MADIIPAKEFREEERLVKVKLEILKAKYVQNIEEGIEIYTKDCVKIEREKETDIHNRLLNMSIDYYQILTKKTKTRKNRIKKLNRKKKKYQRAVNFYEFIEILGGEILPKTLIFYENDKIYQVIVICFKKEKNARKFARIFFRLYPETRYNEEFSEVI